MKKKKRRTKRRSRKKSKEKEEKNPLNSGFTLAKSNSNIGKSIWEKGAKIEFI